MLGFSILTSTNSLLRTVALPFSLSFSTSPVTTAGLTRKILQEKKYRDLQESLKDQTEQSSSEVLLSVARFVLNENIGVARETLRMRMDDVLYFSNCCQTMDKRLILRAANRHGCDMPAEVRIKKFTAKEDSVILSNLKHLQLRAGLDESEAEVMFARQSSESETSLRCKILAGLYLSQALPYLRFPCEVFHRAKLLSIKTGEFTAEEDQIIEDFVSTQGGKWSQLSRILNRNEHSILNRYNAHIKHKDSARRGQFSLEEDLKILQFYFSNCENVLEKNVKYYQLSHQLGSQLSRKPSTVYGRWVGVIQPLLTRDCRAGGCLEVDFTTILINYMVNNGLKYSQDVRWEDLVTLSQFEGTTTKYLQRLYDNAVSCTKKKYGLRKEEITSNTVLTWLEDRMPRRKRKNLIEREEKIIEFYQFLSEDREHSSG